MQISEEIEESAKIDGAGIFRILFQIIIPISLPMIATIGMWNAVEHWNRWFDSMLYIISPENHVVQIYLRRLILEASDSLIKDQNSILGIKINPETIKSSTLVLTMLPILCVYPFIYKYFAKGVMVGSVKG